MITVTLKPLFHRSQESIGIHFPFDTSISNLVTTVPGAKRSGTHFCWYIPVDKDRYQLLIRILEGKALVVNSELKQYLQQRRAVIPVKDKPVTKATANLILTYPLSPPNTEALTRYKQMLLLRAYSPKTARTDCNAFHHLLRLLKVMRIKTMTKDYYLSCGTN